MDVQAVVESGEVARGAQQVAHQGSAAGSQLHQLHLLGLSELLPLRDAPNADELAKDLVDFGRRDEMALFLSDHIAVVIETQGRVGERDFGKFGNGQGSLRDNQVLDVLRQVFGVCAANLYTTIIVVIAYSSCPLRKSREQNGSPLA